MAYWTICIEEVNIIKRGRVFPEKASKGRKDWERAMAQYSRHPDQFWAGVGKLRSSIFNATSVNRDVYRVEYSHDSKLFPLLNFPLSRINQSRRKSVNRVTASPTANEVTPVSSPMSSIAITTLSNTKVNLISNPNLYLL